MSHSGHGACHECDRQPSTGSEPAHGIYDFAVDLDLEVEVAAGRCSCGATQRDGIAAADSLPHLDVEGRQVVVRGLEAVAVINHGRVAPAVLMPPGECDLACGCGVNGGSALGHEVLATVEVAGAAGKGADTVAKRRCRDQFVQRTSQGAK